MSSVPGVLAVIGAMTVLGCGGGPTDATRATWPSVPAPGPATGLAITTSGLSLVVGAAEHLPVRAYDSAGRTTTAAVEWSSADRAVATVSKTDGVVSAISAGTTTVTATTGALSATATVSVFAISGSIAFTRWTQRDRTRTTEVLSFSAADRTTRSLGRPGQSTSVAAPAWSADGTLLAVEVIPEYFAEVDFVDYNSDVYIADAANPANVQWRQLTMNRVSRSPSWSPDGKRIAYLQQDALFSNNNIYIADAAGGGAVRVTWVLGVNGAPRWSPDGRRLAFTNYGSYSAWGLGNGDVFVVNADGSGLTNVTANSAFDADPSWSPDGTRLAFVSDRAAPPGNLNLDVFVVDVDGSNVKRLTSLGPTIGTGRYDEAGKPAWSPDGRQIVFSTGAALCVMNADGSALAWLTRPGLDSWDSGPAWRR